MLAGFLDRISGLFDKGLVLAALFPLLIFTLVVVAIHTIILGFHGVLAWIDRLPVSAAISLGAIAILFLVLLAFVLRSLRSPIIVLWSGAGAPQWVREREAKRQQKLADEIAANTIWEGAKDKFEKSLTHENRERGLPDKEKRTLFADLAELRRQASRLPAELLRKEWEKYAERLATAYAKYEGESLIPVRHAFLDFIEQQENEERMHRQTLRSRLAIEFGPSSALKATKLGNIFAGLDNYPFQRYQMEGSPFWPHLEQMMQGDLLQDVQNHRVLLDFLLALATLFGLLSILAVTLGPWILINPIWFLIAIAAVVLAYLAYLAALPVGIGLSRSLRAGCDLYRHDLLVALGVEVPESLEAERSAWVKLSQLVVYGETRQLFFRLRPLGGESAQ